METARALGTRHQRLGGLKPLRWNNDPQQMLPYTLPAGHPVEDNGQAFLISKSSLLPEDVLHFAGTLCESEVATHPKLNVLINAALLLMDGTSIESHGYTDSPSERQMVVDVPEMIGSFAEFLKNMGEVYRSILESQALLLEEGDFVGLYRLIGRTIEPNFRPDLVLSRAWQAIMSDRELFDIAMHFDPRNEGGWESSSDVRAQKIREVFNRFADCANGGLMLRSLVRFLQIGWEGTIRIHLELVCRSKTEE